MLGSCDCSLNPLPHDCLDDFAPPHHNRVFKIPPEFVAGKPGFASPTARPEPRHQAPPLAKTSSAHESTNFQGLGPRGRTLPSRAYVFADLGVLGIDENERQACTPDRGHVAVINLFLLGFTYKNLVP